MKTGHDLGFAFGDIKGGPVGLSNAGDEIDHKDRQQRYPEPVKESPAARLGPHDIPQIEAAGSDQNHHQGKAHGDFIGDYLRTNAYGAEKCIF